MKKGDSLRVFIENVQVGRGEITAVRDGEIEVTVPGFVSVIATRTSLTDEPTSLEQNNSNREVQVSGIEVIPQTTVIDGDNIKPGTIQGAERIVDGTITAQHADSTAPQTDATNNSVQPPAENTQAVETAPTASTETPVENV